jgi:hypothetical protein
MSGQGSAPDEPGRLCARGAWRGFRRRRGEGWGRVTVWAGRAGLVGFQCVAGGLGC